MKRSLILLPVVWLANGSVFAAIKIGVGTIPPILLACLRFLPAGLLLYFIASRLKRSDADPIGPRQVLYTIAVGISLAFVNGVVMLASTKMDSWMVSVLTCTIPLWAYVATVLSRQRAFAIAEGVGVVLGLAGIVTLVWPNGDTVRIDIPMAALLVFAAIVWGATTVWEKTIPIPKRPLVAVSLQMFVAGVALAVGSAAAGEVRAGTFHTFGAHGWEAVAYLVTVGAIVAYGAFMILLVDAGPTVANSYGYVSPAIAVLLGWWLLHEAVTIRTFVAFALIVIAVALILAPHPLRAGKPIEHRM